jgi:hypothetical protein
MRLTTAAATAALALCACKGPEDWLADLQTVHDDKGRLVLERYDAGQLSYEAMSGLAEQEILTLSQTARSIALAARVLDNVEQPHLRSQAVALIARLAVRYPIPPLDAPFAEADPVKAGELAFKQIEALDRFDRVFEVERLHLPQLKSPDRAVVEQAVLRLKEATGADVGSTYEAWEAWWRENQARVRADAGEGSREPLRILAGLSYGDPEKGTGLQASRAVLRYLGYRAALFDFPELREETERAIFRTARQVVVAAIANSLRADDPELRLEAARAAERVADPAFGSALLYALPRERSTPARVAIMRALALYPGRAAVVAALVEQVPEEEDAFKAAGDADRSLALEAHRSLVAVTGEDFGLDAGAWRLWWEKTGKRRWP